MIYRLVYLSATRGTLDAGALDAILATSRRNNAADGISGLLLIHEGNVMQVLEGPEDAVQRCFGRIARDPRHRSTIVLSEGPASERLFADWSMGYVPFTGLAARQQEAFFDLRDLRRRHGARLSGDARIRALVDSYLGSFGDLSGLGGLRRSA